MKGSVAFLKLSTWMHIRILRHVVRWKAGEIPSWFEMKNQADLISWSQQICESHVFITSSSWNLWKNDVDIWHLHHRLHHLLVQYHCHTMPHARLLVGLFVCPLLSRLHSPFQWPKSWTGWEVLHPSWNFQPSRVSLVSLKSYLLIRIPKKKTESKKLSHCIILNHASFPRDGIRYIYPGSHCHHLEDGGSFWMMTKPKPLKNGETRIHQPMKNGGQLLPASSLGRPPSK